MLGENSCYYWLNNITGLMISNSFKSLKYVSKCRSRQCSTIVLLTIELNLIQNFYHLKFRHREPKISMIERHFLLGWNREKVFTTIDSIESKTFVGNSTFQFQVCKTPSVILTAKLYTKIQVRPIPFVGKVIFST